MRSIPELTDLLIKAKDAYYNGTPIMSDSEFDKLEEDLKNIDPNNKYFEIVGAPSTGKAKIKHRTPMLSLDKAKTVEDVVKYWNKITEKRIDWIAEPKIDGLSATIVYVNGELTYVATRGDGKVGQDITYAAKYINSIPKQIGHDGIIEVRGELFLPKNTQFPNPDNKPLRNLASGLINRKSDREDIKYVEFMAYNVIGPVLEYETDKINYLQKLEFNIPDTVHIFSKSGLTSLYEIYLDKLRDKWLYETDGLVIIVDDNKLHEEIDSRYVVSHHHHYAIALKPPSIGKHTTFRDIEWNISRLGNVVPTAIFDSIVIGGSTVTRATLNNAKNVKELKLQKGDWVYIEKANDVIPFFSENKIENKETDPKLIPENCPSCNSELEQDGVHLVCKNLDCKEQKIQKIIYWITKSSDQISDGIVRQLYEARFIEEIEDLYFLKKEDIKNLDKQGERSAEIIIEAINKSRDMTIEQFITNLGILQVGEKAVKKMGIKTFQDFIDFNDETYVIGQNLIKFRDANIEMISRLFGIVKILSPKITNTKGLVCMTGTGPKSRKELITEIQDKGYEFTNSITKDVNILICDDISSSSSKIQKARKAGITLITYSEFFN